MLVAANDYGECGQMSLQDYLSSLSAEQLSRVLGKLEEDGNRGANNDGAPAPANKREVLVAYYIPETISDTEQTGECQILDGIDEDVLRDYCSDRLTTQQCPTRFVALNKFPRLPNGKLALAQLPLPDQVVREHEPDSEGDSETVIQLLSLLGELLDMSDVRSSDNFFEIGGDSITAIQFISKARDAGLNLGVEAVSESNTIAEMANHCVIAQKSIQEKTEQAADNQSGQQGEFAASGLDENELDDFLQSFD